MARKVSSRIASQLKALQTFPEKQREAVKAQKAAARLEQKRIKAEEETLRVARAKAERERMAPTDRRRYPGVFAAAPPPVQAPPPAPAVPVQQPPAPKPEQYQYETTIDRSTGTVTKTLKIDPRTGEPLLQAPSAPTVSPQRVAESADYRPPRIAPGGRVPKIFEGGKWREMTAQEIAAAAQPVQENKPTDWFAYAQRPRHGGGSFGPTY